MNLSRYRRCAGALAQLMSLLDEEDFNEARNVSALFLGAGMAAGPGPTLNERPR